MRYYGTGMSGTEGWNFTYTIEIETDNFSVSWGWRVDVWRCPNTELMDFSNGRRMFSCSELTDSTKVESSLFPVPSLVRVVRTSPQYYYKRLRNRSYRPGDSRWWRSTEQSEAGLIISPSVLDTYSNWNSYLSSSVGNYTRFNRLHPEESCDIAPAGTDITCSLLSFACARLIINVLRVKLRVFASRARRCKNAPECLKKGFQCCGVL